MDDSPSENPPQTFPAHWIAAGLALAGTGLIQADWGAALAGPIAWRPYSAAALAAATAWLLSTTYIHWRLVAWQPGELPGRFRRLLPLAFSELLVTAFAGLLLWQGHTSHVYRAGLWLVPPALLAAGGTSLVVVLAAAASAGRELRGAETAPSDQSAPSDRWRTALVLALFISLGLLGRQPLPVRTPAAETARNR